jgi:DNA-binding response OmpR family regulator
MVREVLAGPAPLGLDLPSRRVLASGQPVPVKLTATETAVLAALLRQQGRVLSRRQLLAAAGRPAAGDRAPDVVISQLRAKIGGACTIRTVRGAGYAIGGSVTGD